MPIAEYYVDPSVASDGGAGTSASPWTRADQRVIQYALDNISGETAGVRINVKAGSASLDYSMDLATYAAGNTISAVSPLILQGYTTAVGDGGRAEIDCGGLGGGTDGGSDWKYTRAIDLEIHNCGANIVLQLHAFCCVIGCHLYDGTTGVLVNEEGTVIGNYVHDVTSSGIQGGSQTCFVYRNLVVAADTYGIFVPPRSVVLENMIYLDVVGALGIFLNASGCSVVGNSIYQNAAGTQPGVHMAGSVVQYHLVGNNLIEGFSGVGGDGINFASKLGVSGGNAVNDCESAYTSFFGNLIGDDETLSATPFDGTNFGTAAAVSPGDFSPQDTGGVRYGSRPRAPATFANVSDLWYRYKGAIEEKSAEVTAALLADAVLAATVTEGYAAPGTAPTMAQMLTMLLQIMSERSQSGTTLTVKKLDGATTAMTYTLDDAIAPTSQTRAT